MLRFLSHPTHTHLWRSEWTCNLPGVVDPAGETELVGTSMASNGTVIARDSSGKVVFVEGTIPGESIRARRTGETRSYSEAVATEVLEASPDRVVPECRALARGCGGCQWQHISPRAQIHWKETVMAEALRRIGRIEDPPLRPTVELEPWHYRTTLRVAVQDGRASLRKHRSSDLVTVGECLIVHPLLRELLEGRRYDGAEEVILRCGSRTGLRMACPTPAGVTIDTPPDVSGLEVYEEAAGFRWRISARSFFQSRPDGVDALSELVCGAAAEIGAPRRAADLYCGVGVFAGGLARAGWSVTAVESSASSVGDARSNLAGLDATVVRSDVRRWRPAPADFVVADPSRAGLGRGGVRTVVAAAPLRVVLISCDPASMGRDAALLRSAGYQLMSCTPVDLFPQTFHIEALSVFDRAAG